MTRLYKLSDVIDDIQQLVNSFSTQKKTAEFLGISEQYLSDLLYGRREPGETLLKRLGYKRIIRYIRTDYRRK